MDLITLAILGGLGLYIFAKVNRGENLVYYPDGIASLSFDGATPVVVANLRIQNPSNSDFTIQSFAGNAYIDDTLVGNVSNFIRTYIPPNNQIEYPITIELSLIGAADQVISYIQNPKAGKALKVNAVVNAEDFQETITINLPLGI